MSHHNIAIAELQLEIAALEAQLALKYNQLQQLQSCAKAVPPAPSLPNLVSLAEPAAMSSAEIARYSRHLLLDEIGLKGQLALKHSKVLIVGAGGLGSPAALYLAAAGVGKLGLVDFDDVDVSNLQRQIIHSMQTVGVNKAKSAAAAIHKLNPFVETQVYSDPLTSANALAIIHLYDVVLDATDNVATRYLINDACVLADKPLISGSALRMEGQLTTYHWKDGPCYRCLFPRPPPPDSVTNCSEAGVLGVIPGVIGILQALETVRIITVQSASYHQQLLLFDGTSGRFRSVKLRSRNSNCDVCGVTPIIKELLADYSAFCESLPCDKTVELHLLRDDERISPQCFKELVDTNHSHLLVDVRSRLEYEFCRIQPSINIPITDLLKVSTEDSLPPELKDPICSIYFLCRRGNDSQLAVQHLQRLQPLSRHRFRDLTGGLHSWSRHVDPNFPIY